MATPVQVTPTCVWSGISGKTYTYYIHQIGTQFIAAPGNYVFAKVVNGRWAAVYVGETENLAERFDYHHAMPCIRANGATHIHAHVNHGGGPARRDEETDIRRNYNPSCNRQ